MTAMQTLPGGELVVLVAVATAKEFLGVRTEGRRRVRRRIRHCNLDAIIPVAYRRSATRASGTLTPPRAPTLGNRFPKENRTGGQPVHNLHRFVPRGSGN